MAQKRRTPEIIAGRVNGADGVLIVSTDSRVVTARFSAGGYTITFPPDFRVLAMTVSPAQNASWSAIATPGTGNAFQVNMYATATAALGDAPWNFVAVGVQQ